MNPPDQPCQATPAGDLRQQILDSRVPKNEREWWASRTIEKLERELTETERLRFGADADRRQLRCDLSDAKAEASHYMAVAQKATDELIFFRADNLKAHQMTCAAGLERDSLRAEVERLDGCCDELHTVIDNAGYPSGKDYAAMTARAEKAEAEVERWKTVAAEMSQEREHNANEASRLRAEVERLTPYVSKAILTHGGTMLCSPQVGVAFNEQQARAERAEAELADWSVLNLWGGTPEIVHEFIKGQQTRIHHCQDLEAELITERARLDYLALHMGTRMVAEALNCDYSKCFPIRDAIDAAMKNETTTP